MEKKFYPIEKADLASLKTAQSRKILKHVLSPLEEAAFKNAYQPFTYTLEKGISVYVTHYTCKHILNKTREKLDLLLNCTNKMVYFKDIPSKYWETFDDPRIVLSLPPVLRNRLCKLECYTLLTIVRRGRKYFLEQGFSPATLKTLDKVFAKYKSEKLFQLK